MVAVEECWWLCEMRRQSDARRTATVRVEADNIEDSVGMAQFENLLL